MIKKTSPNGLLTCSFLAFAAMSGLSYINFLPGVVSALAGDIGFSESQAGQIVSANGYGAIVGSLIAIFLVRHWSWIKLLLMLLGTLALVDLFTVWFQDYVLLLIWRFFAGVLGGVSVGIAFSVLAKLNNTDRAFGLLLFTQFTIGSLVIYVLPDVEKLIGAFGVFYLMSGFSFISFFLLLFIPDFEVSQNSLLRSNSGSGLSTNACLLLMAIFTYQTSASGIWAYISLIGEAAHIGSDDVSLYIAATGLLGLIGSMMPVIMGNRFGRLKIVLMGVLLSGVSAVALIYSELVAPYVSAMAILFFFWPAVISYLLAVTAECDKSGLLSTIAALVSTLGLATGPLLASILINEGDFILMLWLLGAIFILSIVFLYKPVKTQEFASL